MQQNVMAPFSEAPAAIGIGVAGSSVSSAPEPATRAVSVTAVAQAMALLTYAAWIILVGLRHEAWFDEMQAWLLARDNSFGALIGHYLRYEGTPGLWHIILWCAARAGMPFTSLWIISATCAIGGAAVIVYRAPFPLLLRLGLLATYFYGYQFSVIARGYCLDLLLSPILACLFAIRLERPVRYAIVFGLLANVNAFSFLAAGLLGVELLVRLMMARRWTDPHAVAALAVAFALGAFALWTAWQPADNGFLAQTTRFNPVVSGLIYIDNALFDRITPWSGLHQSSLDMVAGIVISLGLLGLGSRLVLAGRDRALMLVMVPTLIGFAMAIVAASWHAGVLFMFVLFVLWTQWANPVRLRTRQMLIAMLALLEVSQGLQTLRSGVMDIQNPYSAGRPAAAAVLAWRAAHPGARIAAFGGQSFETQPWLPYNVFSNYHHGTPRPQFVIWAKAETWHGIPRPQDWAELLASKPDAILASSYWLPSPVQRDPAGQACQAGYATDQTFLATIPWRGIPQDNTLYLFERATTGPCSGSHPA